MKVGLILECARGGADEQVYSCWIENWLPAARIEPSCAGNKQRLIAEAGQRAKALFGEGCERVLIVWDLWPAWRADKAKPNPAADIAGIEASLRAAGVTHPCVYLVCVDRMLETLLIVDAAAIKATLGATGAVSGLRHRRSPRTTADPKAYLDRHFRSGCRKPYTAHVHAARIARNANHARLDKACPEFARLRSALTQVPCKAPLAWQP